MMNWKTRLYSIGSLLMSLLLTMLLVTGCGLVDAPTASNDDPETSSFDYWNPAPGDEVESGRDVPILDDGYWEAMYGPAINPLLTRPGGSLGGINGGIDGLTATSRPIDGTTGGTVRLGNHSYFVPAGAVDGTVDFTMSYASITGVGVDCGPSPMSFDEPVKLTLSYAGTQYAGTDADPSSLKIYYMSEDGEMIEVEDCVVNTRDQTISAPVLHFSRYILG